MANDTIIKAFSDFISSQTEKIEKKEMIKIVNTVYAELKKQAKAEKAVNEEKQKRKPTAYNIFMQEQMQILKQNEEGKQKENCMTAKEKMQHIAKLWASKKTGTDEEKSSSSDEEDKKPVKKSKKTDDEKPKKKKQAKATTSDDDE